MLMRDFSGADSAVTIQMEDLMRTIEGERYFEVKDLAEFWHCSAAYLQKQMNSSRIIYDEGHKKRVPDPDMSTGSNNQTPVWKVTRLGELNTWRNIYSIRGRL